MLAERTFTFEDELESIESEMRAALADQTEAVETYLESVEADDEDKQDPRALPLYTRAEDRGQRQETFRNGVEWAAGAWDVESVTLTAPNAGMFELTQVITPDIDSGLAGSRAYVAVCTTDGPYVAHKPGALSVDSVKETASALEQVHPFYVMWAEHRINDLLAVGDTGNSKSWRTLQRENEISLLSDALNASATSGE